jgi:hypothetical protein
MRIIVQFLEGGPASTACPPAEARRILREAFARLPIEAILLGWNLPPALVEACAEECRRAQAELYLWHPLLSGDGVFVPRPEWRTIGWNGARIADPRGRDEFTFVCPNRADARAEVLRHLEESLSAGFFQGVFLDRIRFPSPAADLTGSLACFCQSCAARAQSEGVDWPRVRKTLSGLLQNPEGRQRIVRFWLSAHAGSAAWSADEVLAQWAEFRNRSITGMVREAAALARVRGLKIGLDCFSPTLTPMVGQDLAELSASCDWIKGMIYLRAFGPATIPYEILDLAEGLHSSDAPDESGALANLAIAAGWELSSRAEEIRRGRLPSSILSAEIARGQEFCRCPFLAGLELAEIPGVAELDPVRLRKDWEALSAAAPAGVVLSWDLRHIPLERLEMVQQILSQPRGG